MAQVGSSSRVAGLCFRHGAAGLQCSWTWESVPGCGYGRGIPHHPLSAPSADSQWLPRIKEEVCGVRISSTNQASPLSIGLLPASPSSSIGPFVCLLDRFDFTGTTGSGHHVRSDFVECSLLALRSDIFFAAPFRPFQPWRTPLSSFPPPPRIKSSFSCSA